MGLEDVIEKVKKKPTQSSDRLGALADFVKDALQAKGLAGAKGGTGGELTVKGLARSKDWDVAFPYAGKFRLLISLKSMWKNIGGTVPNRLDDHMGELANVQQLNPEIVIGFVVLFDVTEDSRRKDDGTMWSDFFEQAIKKIAIRKAPLWNQGLLEGSWFIRFDSRKPKGQRLVDAGKTAAEGDAFFSALLSELCLREPAVKLKKPRPMSP